MTDENDHLDMPALLDRLSEETSRPRYAFMVLNLIAKASDDRGSAGPLIRDGNHTVPVRDWLCDALTPMGRRDPRRLKLAAQVRDEMERSGLIPEEPDAAERLIDDEVRERVRKSGKTNVSRAVSELVRAGLLRRHYAGRWVDHSNRGGQRQAVYTIPEDIRGALGA